LTYLDKALLLAPKSPGLYATARSLHTVFRDLDELKKLDQRFRIAAPDLTELRQSALEAYIGAKDKEYLEQSQRQIQAFDKLLTSPKLGERPLTRKHLHVSLVQLRQQAWCWHLFWKSALENHQAALKAGFHCHRFEVKERRPSGRCRNWGHAQPSEDGIP
jgi:hypothetical protein